MKKYTLDGSNRFMLKPEKSSAGATSGPRIYTGKENDAPVLYLETDDTPVSIQMYQTKKRERVAGLFGYYGNIGIGVEKPRAKLHVQGQIMMSHNFNNALVARESRKVNGKVEEYQFDLIGTYWGMDRNAIYIGAHAGPKQRFNHAEKVIFGGSSENKAGVASVDLIKGTVSASSFVTQKLLADEDDMMDELEAQALIDVGPGPHDEESGQHIDLGRSSHYLHRKVREQAETIQALQQQLEMLTSKFQQLQQRT